MTKVSHLYTKRTIYNELYNIILFKILDILQRKADNSYQLFGGNDTQA